MEYISSCNVCEGESLLKVDPAWNLCCCNDCGFVFDNPRPTLDELVAFYSQTGKYDTWLDEEAARDALWKRRLKLLLPYRSQGNILDIGTGIGQFLHIARPFFTEVHGTEVSRTGVDVAREKYGIDVAHGVVEELSFPDQSFNNVTLFHVLEHVPDPGGLVRTCWRLLAEGGTLVVAVPNDVLSWTSLVKRVGRLMRLPQFSKFSPVMGISKAGSSREIHLSHFTPAVLQRLLETRGFSVVFTSIDPYYTASGPKLAAHSGYYAFHRALYSLTGENRYQTIMMIARKRA